FLTSTCNSLTSALFPCTTLFRSEVAAENRTYSDVFAETGYSDFERADAADHQVDGHSRLGCPVERVDHLFVYGGVHFELDPCGRSEEHTSVLQSRFDLVCRLLLY